MSKSFLVEHFEFFLFRILIWICKICPHFLFPTLGKLLSCFALLYSPSARKTIRENVNLVFSSKSAWTRKKMLLSISLSSGLTFSRILRFFGFAQCQKKLNQIVNNTDWHPDAERLITEAARSNKTIVFAGMHYGNWEQLAFCLNQKLQSLSRSPLHVLYRPFDNRLIDRLIKNIRSQYLSVIPKTNIGMIRKCVLSKGCLGILLDQNETANPIFVNFFETPAATSQGGIYYSYISKAILILPVLLPQKNGREHLKAFQIKSPVEKSLQEYKRCLHDIHSIFEKIIKQEPKFWLWTHPRWNNKPKHKKNNKRS